MSRCWQGYEPVPGKDPKEKGSCRPIKKSEDEVKYNSGGQWSLHNFAIEPISQLSKTIDLTFYDDSSIEALFPEDITPENEEELVKHLESLGYEEVLEKGLKAEYKSDKGGMTAAGVKAYRHENPGSKLQTAVSEANPTGIRAARRRSFCARAKGQSGPMKDDKGRPTRKALALRRWRC